MNLLIPVLLAALTQPGSDPQKLFLSMEEKIANASSVQVTFSSKFESNKGDSSGKGTLVFAPKKKFRANLDLDLNGKQMKTLVVSDGTNAHATSDGQEAKVEPVPPYIDKALVTMSAKTGIMAGFLFISGGGPNDKKDPFEGVRATDFKLGKAEKLDGKETQVVEFKLTIPEGKLTLAVMIWIDTKTTTPVKRQLVANMGGERMVLTESYSEFRLNAQVDAKTFELPKK